MRRWSLKATPQGWVVAQWLVLFVAVLGTLISVAGSASAAPTSPSASSAVAVGSVLNTRVGVARLPGHPFVGSRTPGNPAGVGEIGCGYHRTAPASCVATETGPSASRARSLGAAAADDPALQPMLGATGTQVTSRTLANRPGFRIDVENPAPGVRAGQLHLQDAAGGKYLYNFEAEAFEGLPKSLARQVARDPAVARAIATGKRYLGVD